MLYLFPRDVLDKIWDLIESVSVGFPTYTLLTSGFNNKKHHALSLFCSSQNIYQIYFQRMNNSLHVAIDLFGNFNPMSLFPRRFEKTA